MKLISISTDRKVFDEHSDVRKRVIEYGKIFDKLDIVVFSKTGSVTQIAEHVWVHSTSSKNKLSYIFDAFKIASKLITPDSVISTQDPFETGFAGLLLKLKYKAPFRAELHTDFANRYFITHSVLNFMRFPLGLFVLSFADSVRVVSGKIAKSIHALSHNVSVLPIYTELKMRNEDGGIKEKEKKEVNFLTVCRLEKEKDLGTLLKAFKKVLNNGIVASFTIVGDGGEMNSLKKLAQQLNIGNKVNFVGWQNNLEEFYTKADIYVSASLYEGYGMSMVEAASSGLPLIISDTGVAGSLFKEGESAFILKQKDENGFAQAMTQLATDVELRKRMGEAAKKSAESASISFEDYLQKYKDSVLQAIEYHNSNRGIFKKNILLRYLVSGITGACIQIGSLYVFTDRVGLWYIYSSILSFLIAMTVSFNLQKFWTFGDMGMQKAHHQFVKYVGVAIIGLLLNTVFMYVLVDLLHIWYIFAQIITGALIAILNFLLYKFFIFHKQ